MVRIFPFHGKDVEFNPHTGYKINHVKNTSSIIFICMRCIKCNIEHDGSFGSGKYCSRSCANSRSFSYESNQKRSESLKNSIPWNKGKLTAWINTPCEYCGEDIFHMRCNKKRFHPECWKKSSGGYRKGSGRGKSGWYKGIWCDSSYELAWVMYHLDHNIPFKRNTKSFEYEYNGEVHLYYPDFRMLDTNELVEIKGFYTEQTYVKLKSVVNTALKILNKDDMITYVQYAFEKYGQNFISYYEGNPHNQMTNRCKQCGNPCKRKSVYCSRQCAGRGNNRNSKLRR